MASRMDSTEPIWAPETPAIPALSADSGADVCVVGAGIAGLSTAYLLGLLGRSVIVLEQDAIGSGETGRTTAHLTSVLDVRYHELRSIHGDANAHLAAASHAAAVRHIEAVVQAESLDCDFLRVDGYLVPGTSSKDGELEKELEACQALGLHVEWLEAAPPPFGRGPALRFPDQARFHPLRYLAGLSRAIRSRGGSIVRARAEGLGGDENEVLVRTEQGPTVRAKTLVVATHAPVHQSLGVHLKQAPYRTYVVAFRVEKSWDWPCHGSRFAPDGTVLNGPAREALVPSPDPVHKV